MAYRMPRPNSNYGFPNALSNQFPDPIISNVAPTNTDEGEPGQVWVHQTANVAYMCIKTDAGATTWASAPLSAVAVAVMSVDPGDLTVVAGDLIVTAGNATIGGSMTSASVITAAATINGALGVTGVTTLADVNIVGNCTITGDFDLTNTASTLLQSTNNAAGALTLQTNGGVLETILIQTVQGTDPASILLDATVGGVTLQSALASADAINISATNAAGGVDIDAGTAGIIVDTTGAISLDSAAASNFTVTGAFDLTLRSTTGSVIVNGGEAAVDAVRILAANAAGGIDIDCGTGGATLDTTGAMSLDSALSSNITVTGAAADLSLLSVGGSVIIDGSEAVANAILIQASDAAGGIDCNSGTAGLDVDSTGSVNIDSALAAADSLRLLASDVAGGIDIDSGTAGITIDTTGAMSLDSAAASNVTVTGVFDLTLASVGGSVIVNGTEGVVDAIQITASDAAGGVTLTAGTTGFINTIGNGPFTVTTGTGAVNISADATANAVNIATGGGVKTLIAGSTNGASVTTLQSGTGAMTFTAGGIFDANVVGAITLDSTAASNFTVTGAGLDLTLSSVGGSVAIASNEAVATAVNITASDAAGGVTLTAGTAGIALTAPFVNLGGIYLYVGAGVPGNPLAVHIGDVYIRNDAAAAAERMYIATAEGAWTNVTCAA